MITYDFKKPVKFAEIAQQRTQVLINVESLVIEYQKKINRFWTLPMVHFACAACTCLFLFALFNYIY